jgi:hypothetical protein
MSPQTLKLEEPPEILLLNSRVVRAVRSCIRSVPSQPLYPAQIVPRGGGVDPNAATRTGSQELIQIADFLVCE